jgi:DNA helicase-2/ATP-dependent DNA helicase PcrA
VDYSKNILEEAPEIFIGDTIVHTILGEGLVVDKKANYIDVLFKHPYGKKTLLSNHKNVKRKL